MSTVHMKKNDEINTGSTLDRNQDNSACEGVLEEIFKDMVPLATHRYFIMIAGQLLERSINRLSS